MKTLLASLVLAFSLVTGAVAQTSRPDVLEVISITGEITDGTAQSVAKQVEEINENPKAKAVLLVVDSPGGGVLASAVIYGELAKLKVPVQGWCDNLCASGGMYALMAPTVKSIGVHTDVTISGSIGVVMQTMRFNRLLEWAKIDAKTYKSGFRKDEGNPTRAAEPEEEKNLQAMIDSLANKFYNIVEKSRGPKIKDWADVKSARIYFGEEGVKAGLIDGVMTKDEAILKAKLLSGSKTIFTREELKKMSKQAERHDPYSMKIEGVPSFNLATYSKDIQFIMETAREIKEGSSVKVEYRMPYKF
jgi:protease-4